MVMREEELTSAELLTTGPVRQPGDGCRPPAGARLRPPLLLMLVALACALAAAGIGRGAVRSFPPPLAQHAEHRGHPWWASESPGPGGT